MALIDWETAGPADPMIELAQACWLNAKLFSDDVAEREGLPSLLTRLESHPTWSILCQTAIQSSGG